MSVPSTNASPAPGSRGRQTRERILGAAAALFAAHGFPAVTMRAIGDAAGIDNSSVYRHFESKSALAREVLRRAMVGLAEDTAQAAATTPPTLDGIVDLVTSAALHLWDHPDTARLVLHWVTAAKDATTAFDVSLPVDAADAPSGQLYRRLVEILERARQAGAIRDVAWPEAFVAIVGAIALRPATYRSFLASQEPDRTAAAARAAWHGEVRALLRGALEP